MNHFTDTDYKKLTNRIFDPTKIPKPELRINQQIFNDPHLNLEIGAGAGLHPVRWSQLNPNSKLMAIEKTSDKFMKMEKRIKNNNIQNVIPIHADAANFVAHYVNENSLDHCYILFPNPNPKENDHSKRWARMPFMGFLKTRLKSGGTLIMATNEQFYYEEAIEWMVNAWKFKILKDYHYTKNDFEGNPRTHFEKKYLERGMTIYNLEFGL